MLSFQDQNFHFALSGIVIFVYKQQRFEQDPKFLMRIVPSGRAAQASKIRVTLLT